MSKLPALVVAKCRWVFKEVCIRRLKLLIVFFTILAYEGRFAEPKDGHFEARTARASRLANVPLMVVECVKVFECFDANGVQVA